MTEQSNMEVPPDAEVLEIDAAQLEQLLNIGDGAAEFVDQHGNTIRLTAEELIEAGFATEALEPGTVGPIEEGAAYTSKTNGEYYLIETAEQQQPPRLDLEHASSQSADAPSGSQTVATVQAAEKELDRPPVLSASVPLRAGSQSATADPALYQDAKQLNDLLEEYRRELQEKEQRVKEWSDKLKMAEKQARSVSTAVVKNVEWDEAEVHVGTAEAPDNLTATVYVKHSKPHDVPSEDMVPVRLESGETCFVIAEDLSGQNYPQAASSEMDATAGVHSCDRCPRRFTIEAELKRHQETSHVPRFPFFCTYCQKDVLVANETVLQAHIRIFHYKASKKTTAPPVQQTKEEQEPQWELLSADRMTDVTPAPESDRVQGGEHMCTLCSITFPTAFSARKHARDEHSVTDEQHVSSVVKPAGDTSVVYTCDVCQKTFSKKEYLKKHKIAHTDKIPHACKFCPCRFKWKENLQKHLNTHGSHANFKCPDCRLVFFNQTRLDVHYKSRHPGRGRDQVCPLCERAFHEKDSLAKHMRGHSKTPVRCFECRKKFTDHSFLMQHLITHTGLRRYICEICNRVFSRVEHLAAHRHAHMDRRFACGVCSMRFSSRESLKEHCRRHLKQYPYGCNKCGRYFSSSDELRSHAKTHQRRKAFQCGKCTKTFASSGSLRVHMASHRQILRYPCPKCDNAFHEEEALNRHMQLHSGVKPFKCVNCQQSFDTKKAMEKHLSTHVVKEGVMYVIVIDKGGATETIRFVCKKRNIVRAPHVVAEGNVPHIGQFKVPVGRRTGVPVSEVSNGLHMTSEQKEQQANDVTSK